MGQFHSVSIKHLSRYLDEFTFRFSNRDSADLFNLTVGRMLETIRDALPRTRQRVALRGRRFTGLRAFGISASGNGSARRSLPMAASNVFFSTTTVACLDFISTRVRRLTYHFRSGSVSQSEETGFEPVRATWEPCLQASLPLACRLIRPVQSAALPLLHR